MAENRKLRTQLDRIIKAKATINRLEAALEEQRRTARQMLLLAYELGATQSLLADEFSTSQARMREHLIRAKAERVLNG